MELIIICALLGCIPATIANSKGRSFGLWWLYGFLIFIVAIIHSLCLKRDHKSIEKSQLKEGLVKCPYCAEMVKPEAVKCKHCGSDIKGKTKDPLNFSLLPSDMTVNDFISRRNGVVFLNEYSVDRLVLRIKRNNPELDRDSIEEKYRQQIEDLKNKLPPNIQDEFIRFYSSNI